MVRFRACGCYPSHSFRQYFCSEAKQAAVGQLHRRQTPRCIFPEKRFAGAGGTKNKGVGPLALVQVQVVRCGVVGFEQRQVLAVKMLVPRFAEMDCEKERNVGIVGIEQEKLA